MGGWGEIRVSHIPFMVEVTERGDMTLEPVFLIGIVEDGVAGDVRYSDHGRGVLEQQPQRQRRRRDEKRLGSATNPATHYLSLPKQANTL